MKSVLDFLHQTADWIHWIMVYLILNTEVVSLNVTAGSINMSVHVHKHLDVDLALLKIFYP